MIDFCCFSQNSRKKTEKQKKLNNKNDKTQLSKNNNIDGGVVAESWGVPSCCFCCSGFLKVFATFRQKIKNLEKTKKTTQVLPRPAPPWFCFFGCFFVFWFSHLKSSRKPKKQKNKSYLDQLPHGFVFLVVFFVFLV